MLTQSASSASDLALLGGPPVRTARANRYPVFSRAARDRVAQLLDEGSMSALSKAHPIVAESEKALADFHTVDHALLTSSGHAALHAALIGLELTAGDEVLTSPYSWGASVSCILHNNCVPTFADIESGSGLLSPEAVEATITPQTRALLVPHIYGNPANMTALSEIASRHGLFLIEDGSQAHGARHRGHRVGSFGDASGFSCNGVKPVATSEGGFLLTKQADVYFKATLSCQHAGGSENDGRASEPGFPDSLRPYVDSLIYTYRMSVLSAALAIDQLRKLDVENDARRANYRMLGSGLEGIESVRLPILPVEDESAVHMVTLTFEQEQVGISKATYIDALCAEGLHAFEYLTAPLHRLPRLSPDYDGPRVMWTEPLRRADYDPQRTPLPAADAQVAHSLQLTWNYIVEDEAFVRGIVDCFVKVEENLDALRAFERTASA
jgi:dTDP-4-amino-4,6-dideoxygalactose transaminase